MKKEIVIPEATVTVETKFYVTSYAYERDQMRNVSPQFDTYEEAVAWIAQDLAVISGNRQYEIKAIHGRFDAQ